MSLLLRNGSVLVDGVLRTGMDVHVEDGIIRQIGSRVEARAADEIDVAGCIVAPGYVDLHIHGAAGVMCESGDPNAVRKLSELLPRYGVTGFLPTLAALPLERLRTAVAAIASVRGHEPGACISKARFSTPSLRVRSAPTGCVARH